jgi:uncharacterized protein (TIGR03382 family)
MFGGVADAAVLPKGYAMRPMNQAPAFLIAALGTGFASSASLAGVNLVTNGSFETGNFLGWSVPPNIFLPDPNAQGFWVAGGGGSEGEHFAALSSTNLRFITQILPTTAGQDYVLTFWMRRPDNFPGTFQVRFEGQVVLSTGAPLPDGLNWFQFTVPLHANINGSFIEFGQHAFPAYYGLDDIRVVPIPSPSAAPLLLLGSVVGLRRRRC